MYVEFDAIKNEINIRDRGISFELAASFDFESALIWQDIRKPYPELRFAALGLLDGRVHSLVFTEAAKGIRVISFRKANQREVKRYAQETQS
jgi:uncharacterized DUF497 family protein